MFGQNDNHRALYSIGGATVWALPVVLLFVLMLLSLTRSPLTIGPPLGTRILLGTVAAAMFGLALVFAIHTEAGLYYTVLAASGLLTSLVAAAAGRKAALLLVLAAALLIVAYAAFVVAIYPDPDLCWNCATEDFTVGELWSVRAMLMGSFVCTILAGMIAPWFVRALRPHRQQHG